MSQEVHVGDIGTIFRLTLKTDDTPIDVSGATAKSIIFEKPDGTGVSKTATFYSDGTDGIIEYTTITDDLDQAGSWHVQAKVTLSTGTWSSDVQPFTVYENIEVAA